MTDPIDMSRDELRQAILEQNAKIEANDGRLTADSSADLDHALYYRDELVAELNLRERGDVPEPTPDSIQLTPMEALDGVPVLFAVHNGMLNFTDNTAQFVERSYYLPPEVVKAVYDLITPHEKIGTENFLNIPMGE